MVKGIEPNVFYKAIVDLSPEGIYYERDAYNVFDFIGDLGGVSGIITTLFGLLCYPYALFAYNLRLSKELYRARTKDKGMFHDHLESKIKTKEVMMHMSKKVKQELEKHLYIALKPKDYFLLYMN